MSTEMDERKARIQDTIEQLRRVESVLMRIKRGDPQEKLDGMRVRRLIRLLVEEWV